MQGCSYTGLDDRDTSLPQVGLCLGHCGDPRGVGISNERGTPADRGGQTGVVGS